MQEAEHRLRELQEPLEEERAYLAAYRGEASNLLEALSNLILQVADQKQEACRGKARAVGTGVGLGRAPSAAGFARGPVSSHPCPRPSVPTVFRGLLHWGKPGAGAGRPYRRCNDQDQAQALGNERRDVGHLGGPNLRLGAALLLSLRKR